jgi:hypothetical protein
VAPGGVGVAVALALRTTFVEVFRADRVAGPTRPAGGFQLAHELSDLGAVEQRRKLYRVRARCTVSPNTEATSPGPDPRRLPPRGVALYSSLQILGLGCDNSSRIDETLFRQQGTQLAAETFLLVVPEVGTVGTETMCHEEVAFESA